MHISLMFKFYKAITLWLSRILIMTHFDGFDWPIALKLSPNFIFAGIVVDSSYKKCLKRICSYSIICGSSWVPKCNFLFQLVCNLLFFVTFLPFQSINIKIFI